MSKKDRVSPVHGKGGEVTGYIVTSPATGNNVCFDVGRWEFNGDTERPTFSPSMLIPGAPDSCFVREHFFVRDGKIEYLSDCDHAMAGMTVDLKVVEG